MATLKKFFSYEPEVLATGLGAIAAGVAYFGLNIDQDVILGAVGVYAGLKVFFVRSKTLTKAYVVDSLIEQSPVELQYRAKSTVTLGG